MSSGNQNAVFQPDLRSEEPAKLGTATILYLLLLAALWLVARFFHVKAVADYPVSTTLSFALLFGPYLFFGFGAAEPLRKIVRGPVARISAAALLALPYFVLVVPRGSFQWPMAVTLLATPVFTAWLLGLFPTPANWADWLVLAALGLLIDLGILNTAWPFRLPGVPVWPAGLGGFPKMMMANVALYSYHVIKPISGVGYDLRPQWQDLKIGLREFLFYAPVVLSLGFLLGFLHWQGFMAKPQEFPAAWFFTFFFVALPEELFFRGLLQNLLERHFKPATALAVASVLFGLSHFNKGATFNWRYVLLATIAGVFYGRAWRSRRRLMASSITHSTVDAIWSIWFR
jgi:CAAX protease family protein